MNKLNQNNYVSFYNLKFDIDKFLSLLEEKEKILDFGCGNGIWENKLYPQIEKIYLFDIDKKLKDDLKKKYNSEQFNVINSIKNIQFDVVLMQSVIQYLSDDEVSNFLIEAKYPEKIIISDIPKFNRFIELFLLLLFNQRRFYFSIKTVLLKNYLVTDFYFRNYKAYIKLFKNYKIQKINNLSEGKLTRYSLVLEKIKK